MKEKYIDDNGYYRFKSTDELVHRKIMEDHLKRELTQEEIVHHLDMNKVNNDIENLIVLSWEDHGKLHGCMKRGGKAMGFWNELFELVSQLDGLRYEDYVRLADAFEDIPVLKERMKFNRHIWLQAAEEE